MDCCGGSQHEITVQAGSSILTLVRCGHCAQQTWTLDGQTVDREQAFAHLSGAYRDIPQAAAAARARAEADREARRTARASHQTDVREIRLTDEPAPNDLAGLLEGWQVLGAAR